MELKKKLDKLIINI